MDKTSEDISHREEKKIFYQSKYDYYREFNRWVVVVASLASVTYFVSDCQLFGRFAWETLLPRTFILLPMLIFLLVSRKVTDYRIMVPFTYLIVHGIMWCTIWAIYYLPIRQHANEGFIIMHLMFFAVGFCAPFGYSTLFHVLVVANILISNLFNHYESLNLMLTLGIPCVVGICAVNYVMEKVYADQYKTKLELEKALTMDQLTKAFNRNKLVEICDENDRKLLVDNSRETCIIITDVDYFKKVNDTYGHDAGDKVLIYLVDTIKQVIRSSDYVIRWGGEEFLVILPGCPLTNAKNIAESIRQKIESGDNGICKITISMGISSYDGTDYHKAIVWADQALYEAKNSGRNRVVCYKNEEE